MEGAGGEGGDPGALTVSGSLGVSSWGTPGAGARQQGQDGDGNGRKVGAGALGRGKGELAGELSRGEKGSEELERYRGGWDAGGRREGGSCVPAPLSLAHLLRGQGPGSSARPVSASSVIRSWVQHPGGGGTGSSCADEGVCPPAGHPVLGSWSVQAPGARPGGVAGAPCSPFECNS